MKHGFPPGEQSRALNPERRFLLQHIGFDKNITKALGNYYVDEAGNRYLDFLAQYGAVPFGHNPAALWETIYRHGSEHQPAFVQPLTSPGAEALAARLVDIAPGKMRYVTFVNSGAEAAEAAIKLARAHTGRQTILSTVRGFHGKTLGALSATDNPAYRAPFLLDTTCFERIAFDDLDSLETRLMRGDVAAFLVEPIQGEGGMRVPSRGYLLGAARICKQYGTLFVLDEIQTGLGRTGTMFAADAEPGLAPDILLLSKALGGGIVPLGAMLCTKAVWSEAFGFYHSSTFANSHFTCAIGCKVIDMLLADDQAVVRHASAMGELLERGLDALVRTYPTVFAERRGRCLMQALELAPWSGENSYFLSHASKKGFAVPLLSGYLLSVHGIVTAPVFNQNASLRLEPPLTIEAHEIERLLAALDAAARLIAAEDFVGLFSFVSGAPAPASAPARPAPVRALANYQRPAAAEHKRGSFAFMIHPTDDDVLFDTLPPEFAALDLTQKSSWRQWMASWFSRMYEPAAVYHLPALRSHAGGYVEGWLIAAPLTPLRMMRLRKEEKTALLAAYVEVAQELKVDIVGMGAFTSVIARGGDDLLGAPVNLTTGNSLTAIASAESLRAAALAQGRDFAAATVAVIGAAGSIGRLAALHFARYAKCVVLFGNPKNPLGLDKLAEVAGEMYRTAAERALANNASGIAELLMEVIGPVELTRLSETIDAADLLGFKRGIEERLARVGVAELPILLSDTLERDLGKADCVLSASAAGASFIDPAWFAPGCIVCDVARPLDVLGTVKGLRPDVFVYEGGVMRLPEHISFGAQNVLGYPRGYNLACLSETMVLAMDGARRNYSIGSRIDYAGALAIYASSRTHGFEFAVLVDGVAQDVRPLPLAASSVAIDAAVEAVQ